MLCYKWGYQHNCYPPVRSCRKWFKRVKLPNSGKPLELKVPSYYSRKSISGWTNSSCTVISFKASEKKVGNRGSKSIHRIVKEQRVNGSWCSGIPHLRCTLTAFERNSQIKILSKQIRFSLLREFSSSSEPKSCKREK